VNSVLYYSASKAASSQAVGLTTPSGTQDMSSHGTTLVMPVRKRKRLSAGSSPRASLFATSGTGYGRG